MLVFHSTRKTATQSQESLLFQMRHKGVCDKTVWGN